MATDEITASIKNRASSLGFDACGIASAQAEADDGFDTWLDAGFHANMTWLERTRDIRQGLALKVPGAQSVVVLAKYYYRAEATPASRAPRIARYAWSRDYHRALAKPLKQLAAHIAELCPDAQQYASIDSGPVRERAWAARAGLGWIGRNSLLLHPEFGSWCFLATIITTAALTPDTPMPDRCGSCHACIAACPTDAITADRVVDSRRCISYHTIENRSEMPPEIAAHINGWVFGCDICQEACPWNKTPREDAAIDIHSEFASLDPAVLADISDEAFHRLFDGTPVARTKPEGMRRNAGIFLRNNETLQ